jgi:hypothetical protein
MIECLGETVALMRKYEVDPRHFLEIMTETLFAAPVYRTYGALIADQKYEPAGFQLELGLKDVRSVLAAAEAKSVPMPVGSVVRDHFLSAIARGGAHLDWSALAKVERRRRGAQILREGSESAVRRVATHLSGRSPQVAQWGADLPDCPIIGSD